MADVYAAITAADPEMQARIADVLELRAADPQQRAMLETYTADLDLPRDARILEIGCGTGAVSRFLARLPGVAAVVGVDPCELFIERAHELAREENLTFVLGDGRELELEDESFDAVVFHTTLCHVPDCEQAIVQAHRLLARGGQVAVFDGDYITTTVANYLNDPLQACADAAIEALVHDPWMIRRLPSLLRDAGFGDCQLRGFAYTQTSEADYILTLIERGANSLASDQRLSAETAEALKAEARHRVATGHFFGHIAYANAIARSN
jgi:ubiquinone/menaquinone biosynthesis C-methylase UbiE